MANETWKVVQAKSKQAMKQVLGLKNDDGIVFNPEGRCAPDHCGKRAPATPHKNHGNQWRKHQDAWYKEFTAIIGTGTRPDSAVLLCFMMKLMSSFGFHHHHMSSPAGIATARCMNPAYVLSMYTVRVCVTY